MRIATYRIDRSKILESIFPYLVNQGLENITIRELCKATGIAQGSLYYWFDDKTNIVCETTLYGLRKVTDEIFEYVFENLDNLRGLFSSCLDELCKYKKELRFVYQLAASPVYGEIIRDAGQDFNFIYNRYTHRLAIFLSCDENKLKPLVYLFISAVLDYIIWDEREKSQMQLEFIYSAFVPVILKNQEITG